MNILRFTRFAGASLLTAVIVFGSPGFLAPANAATVSAKSASDARAKAWPIIKKSKGFRKWTGGICFKVRATGKGNTWKKIAFTCGNGRIWFIHLNAKKASGGKWNVKGCPSPSAKRKCK